MKILYTIFFFLKFIIAWAQPYTNTRVSDMALKGKVKTVSFESFSVKKNKDGSVQNIVRRGSFYNFNIIFFSHDGFLHREECYEISETQRDTVPMQIRRYFYDKGRVVKILNNGNSEEFDNPDNFDFYTDFTYLNDSFYSRIEQDNFKDDSIRIFSQTNYTITKNLHIIDRGIEPAKPFSSEKIHVDDSGRKISSFIEQEGKVFSIFRFEYADTTSRHPEFSEYIYAEKDTKTRTHNLYNKQNDIIAEQQFDELKMVNTTTYFEYDYDHHINWVEKRSLDEHGQLKDLVRRTITYWDE